MEPGIRAIQPSCPENMSDDEMNKVVWKHLSLGVTYPAVTHLLLSAIRLPPQKSFMLLCLSGPVDTVSLVVPEQTVLAPPSASSDCQMQISSPVSAYLPATPSSFKGLAGALAYSHKKLKRSWGHWQTSGQTEGKQQCTPGTRWGAVLALRRAEVPNLSKKAAPVLRTGKSIS